MNANLSVLETLREDTAAYLRGLGAFQPVTVNTRATGDLLQTIENEIARVGVSVELFIKSARLDTNQSWTVFFDHVVLSVAVYDEVLVNQDPATGSGRGGFWYLEAALSALKLWQPPNLGGVRMPDPAGPLYGRVEKRPNLLILQQDFFTTAQLPTRTA